MCSTFPLHVCNDGRFSFAFLFCFVGSTFYSDVNVFSCHWPLLLSVCWYHSSIFCFLLLLGLTLWKGELWFFSSWRGFFLVCFCFGWIAGWHEHSVRYTYISVECGSSTICQWRWTIFYTVSYVFLRLYQVLIVCFLRSISAVCSSCHPERCQSYIQITPRRHRLQLSESQQMGLSRVAAPYFMSLHSQQELL